jgi:uncharacterized membrane protein YgcG
VSNTVAFTLKKNVGPWTGGSVAVGPYGHTFDVAAALANGDRYEDVELGPVNAIVIDTNPNAAPIIPDTLKVDRDGVEHDTGRLMVSNAAIVEGLRGFDPLKEVPAAPLLAKTPQTDELTEPDELDKHGAPRDVRAERISRDQAKADGRVKKSGNSGSQGGSGSGSGGSGGNGGGS